VLIEFRHGPARSGFGFDPHMAYRHAQGEVTDLRQAEKNDGVPDGLNRRAALIERRVYNAQNVTGDHGIAFNQLSDFSERDIVAAARESLHETHQQGGQGGEFGETRHGSRTGIERLR